MDKLTCKTVSDEASCPRRFLFRRTLGRFQTEEAQITKASKNVKDLTISVQIMKKESEKLLERAKLAENEMTKGYGELRTTGGDIKSLAKSVHKVECQANDLVDDLREIAGRDAIQLRAEVAKMASTLKEKRLDMNKRINNISELGVRQFDKSFQTTAATLVPANPTKCFLVKWSTSTEFDKTIATQIGVVFTKNCLIGIVNSHQEAKCDTPEEMGQNSKYYFPLHALYLLYTASKSSLSNTESTVINVLNSDDSQLVIRLASVADEVSEKGAGVGAACGGILGCWGPVGTGGRGSGGRAPADSFLVLHTLDYADSLLLWRNLSYSFLCVPFIISTDQLQ
ncbi:hypothetical protein Tco_1523015 [Tanacetum coccineum]